jgi:hypothetical protein
MGGKPKRTLSFKKASLATMVHLKMDVAWTFYKTIDTFYLYNEHKLKKGGLLEPLANFWHISSTLINKIINLLV